MPRDDLFEHIGSYFQPNDTDLLYEWLDDGRRYPRGCGVQDEIYEMNDGTCQPQLRLGVIWKLRHIFFSFNLPIHMVSILWATFFVVVMGTESSDKFIAHADTVHINVARLHEVD